MNAKICKHFGTCGGCQFQDVPYEEQLARKQDVVNSSFAQLGFEGVNPILPSEDIFFYRNKMEFSFGEDITLGLKQRSRFDRVVDIEECLLLSAESNRVIGIVRKWMKDNRVEPYNSHRHEGLLRHLLIRESKAAGLMMVNLILNSTKYRSDYELKGKLDTLASSLKQVPAVSSFVIGFNRGKSDVAKGEETENLFGDGYIEERIGELKFRISPYSFFQTNTRSAEKLYSLVKAAMSAGGEPPASVLDVYCGTGSISLYVSGIAEKVIGVEQVPSAVEDAKMNAQLNGIGNCEFVCERAETFLEKLNLSKFHVKLSAAILDPPRAGLCRKAVNSLAEVNPGTIIYVSCNLKSMCEDLRKLAEFYAIESVTPVDMFPHTPHIETVAKLTHK